MNVSIRNAMFYYFQMLSWQHLPGMRRGVQGSPDSEKLTDQIHGG